jgi:hypothetical protein
VLLTFLTREGLCIYSCLLTSTYTVWDMLTKSAEIFHTFLWRSQWMSYFMQISGQLSCEYSPEKVQISSVQSWKSLSEFERRVFTNIISRIHVIIDTFLTKDKINTSFYPENDIYWQTDGLGMTICLYGLALKRLIITAVCLKWPHLA